MGAPLVVPIGLDLELENGMATPRGPKTSPHHAYLLQVTLEGIDPPIWRWV